MLLLTSTLAALLLGLLAAQNLDVPTFNVDSALAIASSATGQLLDRVHHIWIGN